MDRIQNTGMQSGATAMLESALAQRNPEIRNPSQPVQTAEAQSDDAGGGPGLVRKSVGAAVQATRLVSPTFNALTDPKLAARTDSLAESVLNRFAGIGKWWSEQKSEQLDAAKLSMEVHDVVDDVNDIAHKAFKVPKLEGLSGWYTRAASKAVSIANAGVSILDAAEAFYEDRGGKKFIAEAAKATAQAGVTAYGAKLVVGGVIGGASLLSAPVVVGAGLVLGGGYLIGKGVNYLTR